MNVRGALLASAAGLLLAACSTPRRAPDPVPAGPAARPPATAQAPSRTAPPPARSGRGAYYQDDGPGDNPPPDLESTPDAVPVDEPVLRTAANRPYSVFGKTYTPLTTIGPFRQRGVGSWYGRKFHGQKTSSGEPYDMYAMTAAHPTLPLPSYVRVTNPANGRSVVVRVNDRGPFHSDRIMDLSYTAALKLGYVNQGSAVIEVERVWPGDAAARSPGSAARPVVAAAPPPPAPAAATAAPDAARPAPRTEGPPAATAGTPPPATAPAAATETAVLATSTQPDGLYLQLAAFGAREGAEEFRVKTYQQLPWLNETIFIVARDRLHRVQLGPFADRAAAQLVADRIRESLQLKPMFILR